MIKKVLHQLENTEPFHKKVEHVETLESKAGQYGRLDNLPYYLHQFLQENQIELYKHQIESTKLIREGKNVLITTPTASGKL